jgi:hypothetical protein
VSTGTVDEDGNAVPPSLTPPGYVLGTSTEGFWEPLSLAYIEEQIVTPLQQEIGDPRAVAAHTDLVGFISEVDQRLSLIEVTEAVAAERRLFVDKYSTNFIRVMVVPPTGPWPAKVDFALAETPGVNGTVYPDLASIPGGAAVWADFNGELGRLKMADGSAVYGSTLKEWIRKGTIATVRRDDTDPAKPNLVVEKVEQPTEAGTSLALNTLRDVTAPADTPAGKVLGTTAEGQWGPVDMPSGDETTVPSATWSLESTSSNTYPMNWKYLNLTLPEPAPNFGYQDFYVPPCPPEHLEAIKQNRYQGDPVETVETEYRAEIQFLGSVHSKFDAGHHQFTRTDTNYANDVRDVFPLSMREWSLDELVEFLGGRVVTMFVPSHIRNSLLKIWNIPMGDALSPDTPDKTFGAYLCEALSLEPDTTIDVFLRAAESQVPPAITDQLPPGTALGVAATLMVSSYLKFPVGSTITTHPAP